MPRNQFLHPCTIALAAFTCLLVGTATAQEDAGEEIDVTRLTKLPVVLTDETGNPVVGAEVMAYAMRTKERGAHFARNRRSC